MSTSQILWILAVAIVVASAIALRKRRARQEPSERDRIIAAAILRTNPPVVEEQPGHDIDLLLDAHLAYHGPTRQQRKENPQP
ncbi:hypothetical protein PV733_31735 [Streptomyces europaeiscabiei]|uniref:hypothetical protein n=1 Tax=Streptomyces europaeiscabiei TaxID=146819 RepID=UPI0029AC56AC|nr:hypothetical protein [Streptomyces europaeiscabiei]MDX3713436.1 hypothetical protein [Streptomyces europaeiscabiei]